ncbi:hypothetical protein GGF31_001311 [Allomyces arbusculus]|nr:hypothetical protein GGF31_001311 [Allomyces arbusculus]
MAHLSSNNANMITITHDTFMAALPVVREAIAKADLIALDCEFSGIDDPHATPLDRPLFYDSPEQLYQKSRAIVAKYRLLQLGLCCLTKSGNNSNTYGARAFAFHLCPRAHADLGLDSTVTFQTSALQFMAKNGYDFGLTLGHGIAHLSRADVRHVEVDAQPYPFQAVFRPALGEAIAQIERFLADFHATPLPPQGIKPADLPILLLDRASLGAGDRIELERLFAGQVDITGSATDIRHFHLTPRTGRAASHSVAPDAAHRTRIVKEGTLFGKVMDALVAAKKPVIGHSVWFDLLFIWHELVDDLPPTLAEFCQAVHAMFPTIVDTKYLAHRMFGNAQVALKSLYAWTPGANADAGPGSPSLATAFPRDSDSDAPMPDAACPPLPTVAIDAHHDQYFTATAFHDAAYDAYATACGYLKLAHHAMHVARVWDSATEIPSDWANGVQLHDNVFRNVRLDSGNEGPGRPPGLGDRDAVLRVRVQGGASAAEVVGRVARAGTKKFEVRFVARDVWFVDLKEVDDVEGVVRAIERGEAGEGDKEGTGDGAWTVVRVW